MSALHDFTARQIDELKSEGRYFEAGVAARQAGEGCHYGCHYGMRSERARAIAEFEAGYNAEDTVSVWPRGYAHEEGTSRFKVAAGTDESAIRREATRRFGALASISSISRARAPIASVSDADAAYYSRHDNT
jgi:hypothetical protein